MIRLLNNHKYLKATSSQLQPTFFLSDSIAFVFVLNFLFHPDIFVWGPPTALPEQIEQPPCTLYKEVDPAGDSEPTFSQIVVPLGMQI
jgi:hypothetical protein